MKSNLYQPKQITNKMLEILMDCHGRELMKQAPLNYSTRFAKGLIIRGYIAPGIYNDPQFHKSKLAFSITPQGKEYLNKIMIF